MKRLIASILVVFCVVFGLLAVQPKAEGATEDVLRDLLREIRELREEIAGLRHELGLSQDTSGVAQNIVRYDEYASSIIRDLNSMRSASLMFFADNMDAVAAGQFPLNTNIVSYLTPYLENPRRFSEDIYIWGIMDNG